MIEILHVRLREDSDPNIHGNPSAYTIDVELSKMKIQHNTGYQVIYIQVTAVSESGKSPQ